MALIGGAVLCVWHDPDPATDDDYNEWYRLEHIPERMAVPGMVRMRRYRSEGMPRYFALYEARDMSVLTTGVYRDQLANPTAWTKRLLPTYRFAQRGLCDVVANAGTGVGGHALVVAMQPKSDEAMAAWAKRIVPDLVRHPHIVAAHAWVATKAEPMSSTTALSSGSSARRPVEWVLMVEATAPSGLDTAEASLAADPPPAEAIAAMPRFQALFVSPVSD